MAGLAMQASQAATAYQREQLTNLSSVEVIHKLYEIAILSCKKKDSPLAQRAINELIVGLNFEAGDISVNLYSLYDYCKRCIRAGNHNEAVSVLDELRSTWAQAFNI